MNIMVTGGAGFIGSHLVPHLIEKGHKVVVLDNLSIGSKEHVPTEARLIVEDILAPDLPQIMQEEKIEAVVHLAAQTVVSNSLKHPDIDAEQNVLGTVKVLEAARQSGVKRIVFASSAAVYGDVPADQLPITEDTKKEPVSFYGLTKLLGEQYMDMYHKLYGLDYVILRFSNVYGERQGDKGEGGVISIFAKLAAQGMDLTIYGDGNQTRDFIYVGDITKGISKAIVTENVNESYNLSTQTEITITELAEKIRKVNGGNIMINHKPARSGDIMKSVLSNEKAYKFLLWQAKVNIDNGLYQFC